MSINSILSLAANALQTEQQAIQTTGNNLANISTPGYSRERVNLVSAAPAFEGGVLIGSGVNAAGVQRVVDGFTEAQLLTLNGNVGYSQAENQALASVQGVFPTSGGIDAALSAFFGSLSDLANNPSDPATRESVIGQATTLGQSLAQTRQSLSSIQQNLDQNIGGDVQQVNTLVSQIASLNQQISSIEVGGVSANDSRDQRQTLLQQLTSLTGATTREAADGEVTATVGGLVLVSGNRFASLSANTTNAAGFHEVTYQSPDGSSFDATSLFTQGRIGATLSARDGQVQQAIDGLDQLAKTLVDQVNAQHALGFDLNGNPGGNFFTPLATTSGAAGNVQVASAVVEDPRLIAAAASAGAVPGDNRNAQALAALQSATFPSLGGTTLLNSYLSLIGGIGSQAQNAQSNLSFQQSLLTQTQARRDSVSGVDVNEEMTHLIQFQNAFESSSMLVRTADQMYQSLINMLG